MLRFPVKVALILCGVLLIVLGAHGLYIYTHRVDVCVKCFDLALSPTTNNIEQSIREYGSKLFLSVNMAHPFAGLIWWSSQEAGGSVFDGMPTGGSWLIPVLLIVGGLVLFGAQQGISANSSRFVRRIKHKLWD